jgi:3-oxoacyl-[acyl-carrier protein] reductase
MKAEKDCPSLKGQIAAVVGGLGASGRAVAHRLAEEGAIVILCDLNDSETASVADGLASDNLPVQGVGIDVTSPQSVSAAFNLISQTYGDPTLLCYGIGFHLDTAVGDTIPDLWRHGLCSNLEGSWLCAHELVRRLRMARHGQASAVFLVSEMGDDDNDALTAVTRDGVAALARTLDREYRSIGLRAGALLSGPLPESGAERIFRQTAERNGHDWQETLAAWTVRQGDRLTRRPDDVANAVVDFVCGRLLPSPDFLYPIPPGALGE